MKDLGLGRLIPVAAAGALFATACGDESGNKEKSFEETVAERVGPICERLKACDEEEFIEDWESLEVVNNLPKAT